MSFTIAAGLVGQHLFLSGGLRAGDPIRPVPLEDGQRRVVHPVPVTEGGSEVQVVALAAAPPDAAVLLHLGEPAADRLVGAPGGVQAVHLGESRRVRGRGDGHVALALHLARTPAAVLVQVPAVGHLVLGQHRATRLHRRQSGTEQLLAALGVVLGADGAQQLESGAVALHSQVVEGAAQAHPDPTLVVPAHDQAPVDVFARGAGDVVGPPADLQLAQVVGHRQDERGVRVLVLAVRTFDLALHRRQLHPEEHGPADHHEGDDGAVVREAVVDVGQAQPADPVRHSGGGGVERRGRERAVGGDVRVVGVQRTVACDLALDATVLEAEPVVVRLLGVTCDVQRIRQRPVHLLGGVQRLQPCHRSSSSRRSSSTVRARSSEAIDLLKKLAMVETSGEFYERGTSLEAARIVATIGSRSTVASSANASASSDTRCATAA
jgi:hypothetical protein